MRGAAYDRFGDLDVLTVRDDLPDPPVGPDTVLVRTRAAGVNPVDMGIRAGGLAGLFPHNFPIIPGWDLAGVVEAVGPAVVDFAPGDEVFGYLRRDDVQWGTAAELVPAPQRCLAHKPASLSFTEAGAVPLAGLTALQCLRAVAVGAGDTVLVHAAAGGVGHLAVQIARVLGAARVIGTASEHNHEFLRQLGAEPVSYGGGLVERVTELAGGPVDAALDLVGGDALRASAELVADRSRHVSVIDPSVLNQGGHYVFVRPDAEQLRWLAELADTIRLRVELAEVFPLDRAADAHRLLEKGHVRGKLALEVGSPT